MLLSQQVHAKSTDSHKWLVVLDAAAHVPTHKLDLSHYKPDFVPVSFYKLFGFPSGAAVRWCSALSSALVDSNFLQLLASD